MAAQTFFLLKKTPVLSNQYPFFIGLLTIFGYHFLSKNRFKKGVGWLAGLAAALLFFNNNWPVGRLPIGLIALSASYYFPAVRRLFPPFRRTDLGGNTPLRASTFGKPISIALVWAVVTVAPLFIFFEKNASSPALFLMLAERFFFIAALAIAYDLVDEVPDRAAGLATIPVRFGADFSKKLVIFLLFLALIVVVGEIIFGLYSIKIGAAISFSLFIAAFFVRAVPNNWPTADQKMLIDAAMILQFLGVWASL